MFLIPPLPHLHKQAVPYYRLLLKYLNPLSQPYSLYGQQPTSQYFSTINQNLHISQAAGLKNTETQKLKSFIQTTNRLPINLFSQNNVKPRFQKLISNSLDPDFEQDFGRSFKYELHPVEKLPLAFLD